MVGHVIVVIVCSYTWMILPQQHYCCLIFIRESLAIISSPAPPHYNFCESPSLGLGDCHHNSIQVSHWADSATEYHLL